MERITKKNIVKIFNINIGEFDKFIKDNNIKSFKSFAGYRFYNLFSIIDIPTFYGTFIESNENSKEIYNDLCLLKTKDKEHKLLNKIMYAYLKSNLYSNNKNDYNYLKFKEREIKNILNKENQKKQKNKAKVLLEKNIKEIYSKSIKLNNSYDSSLTSPYEEPKYIIHIGPTNSGKTYNAILDLVENGGTYLAPLRLLAWEIYEKVRNEKNIPCSLITGEERIIDVNSIITSSTIEMFDYNKFYETIVIDECFMLSDKDRGKSWFKAITMGNAKKIHLIANNESEFIIKKILSNIGRTNIEIKKYDRLVPLEVVKIKQGKPPKKSVLITFSRIEVLRYKAFYENKGYNVSVLYGNLPPEVKKSEIEKFVTGKSDICISTDVIGMGLNLPCDNIIFLSLSKFDGYKNRPLTSTEVKQISGRAGRFGLSEKGFVSSQNNDFIKNNLNTNTTIKETYLGFDYNLILDTEYGTMENCIKIWDKVDFIPSNLKENVLKEDIGKYLKLINKNLENIGKENPKLGWSLIYSPVKNNNHALFNSFINSIASGNKFKFSPSKPFIIKDIKQLETVENNLSNIDLFLYFYYNDIFRDYLEVSESDIDNIIKNKYEMIENINIFLLDKKLSKNKACEQCNKNVGIDWPHKLCDKCFRDNNRFYWDDEEYDDYY